MSELAAGYLGSENPPDMVVTERLRRHIDDPTSGGPVGVPSPDGPVVGRFPADRLVPVGYSLARAWVLILVLLLACACAEDVLPPTSTVTGSPHSTSPHSTSPLSTSAPSPPATVTQPPTTTQNSVEVAWVPPGPLGIAAPTCPAAPEPGASTSPPPTTFNCAPETYEVAEPAWKAAFTSRDCAAIGALGTADTARLYLGLRNACAAASDNDPTRWKAAKAALDATDSVFSCPDRLAQGLLARLVAAHERSPNARIRFGAPIVSPQDACR